MRKELDKQKVPQEFDRIARRYDLATSLSRGYQSDLRLSVERMTLRGDERLLDLCCGTGKSTLSCLAALPRGYVIGVDASEEMLAIAREKLKEEVHQERVVFLRQNAMALDFTENSFDAIFMAYGLRNMPDYEGCLRGLLRILKPGGTLCLHEYSLASTWYALPYWNLLGYGVILPLSALVTGNASIFRYLIRSVREFLAPTELVSLLQQVGFEKASYMPLPGYRAPFLHTFLAKKPQ